MKPRQCPACGGRKLRHHPPGYGLNTASFDCRQCGRYQEYWEPESQFLKTLETWMAASTVLVFYLIYASSIALISIVCFFLLLYPIIWALEKVGIKG